MIMELFSKEKISDLKINAIKRYTIKKKLGLWVSPPGTEAKWWLLEAPASGKGLFDIRCYKQGYSLLKNDNELGKQQWATSDHSGPWITQALLQG